MFEVEAVTKKKVEIKTRILFVCKGNICRSPTAHSLFDILNTNKEIIADSAGTHTQREGLIGVKPCSLMVDYSRKKGFAITGNARQLIKEDIEKYDRVIVMDKANALDVRRFGGEPILLMSYTKSADIIVPDPFDMPKKVRNKAFRLIKLGVEGLLEDLK